ncbi:hypothetical protein B0T19DRAFT_473480 [Cercophora scortea]|uniref:Uncharacterized protein n=1 Tax=Cercophora scortea TaxID=314031 RepID=A0AAE0MHF4_9PEZI|nr:hypothetical protein B0T19DRAFT_473480 [Cercophora scortea]
MSSRYSQRKLVRYRIKPGGPSHEGNAAPQRSGDPNMNSSDDAARQAKQAAPGGHQLINLNPTELVTDTSPDIEQAVQGVSIKHNNAISRQKDSWSTGREEDRKPDVSSFETPEQLTYGMDFDMEATQSLSYPGTLPTCTSPVAEAEKWTSPVSTVDSGYASYYLSSSLADQEQLNREGPARAYSSLANALPPNAVSQCVLTFCKDIADRLRPIVANKDWEPLSRKFPDLIQEFAVNFFLRYCLDAFHRRVASSLIRNHQEIAMQLRQNLGLEDLEHARLETYRPLREKMSLSDKMSLWTRVSNCQLEDERLGNAQPCEGASETPEKEVDDIDPVTHTTHATGFSSISTCHAYWSLLSVMIQELDQGLKESRASFDTAELIRREIVGRLINSPFCESPTGGPRTYKAAFYLPWGPVGSKYCPFPPGRELRDCVVLTCSSEDQIEASTVQEYLGREQLPGDSDPGKEFFNILETALKGISSTKESPIFVNSFLRIWTVVKDSGIVVWADGPPNFIVESGVTLAWIAAALQPSKQPQKSGFYRVPVLRHIQYPARQTSSEEQTTDEMYCPSWSITSKLEKLSAESSLRKQALYSQVPGVPPVLIKGFPITPRPEGFSGTEVTAQALFRWVTNPRLKASKARVTLEGEQTTLGLHKSTPDVLLWHVIRSASLAGCTCDISRGVFEHQDDWTLATVDELLEYRHILADCDGTRAVPTGTSLLTVPASSNRHQDTKNCGHNDVQDLPKSKTVPQSLLAPGPIARASLSSATWSPGLSLDSDVLSISDMSEDVTTDHTLSSADPLFDIIDKTTRCLLARYRSRGMDTKEQSSPRVAPRRAPDSSVSNIRQHAPSADPPPSTGSHNFIAIAPSTTTLHPSTKPTSSNRKRNRVEGAGDDDDPDEDDPPFKKPRANEPTPAATPIASRLLACPFWKHDPAKHRGCFRIKLDKISRVKQHLARKHAPGLYCEFCLAVFADRDSHGHQAHVQARSCAYRACELPGMTHQQQRELSRKSNRHASEQDQWFAIWDVIFPDRSRPASAYMDPDLSEDLCHFREFAELHGPGILAAELMMLETPTSPDTNINPLPRHERDENEPPSFMRSNLERVIAHGFTTLFEDWLASRTPSTASTYPSSSRRPSDNSVVTAATPALASSHNATPASSFAGNTTTTRGQTAPSPQRLASTQLELDCRQIHDGSQPWPGIDMSVINQDVVIHDLDPGAPPPDLFEFDQLLSGGSAEFEGWTGIVDWNAGGPEDGMAPARDDLYGTIGPLDQLPIEEGVNPAA